MSAADLVTRMVGDELHVPPAREAPRQQDFALEILSLSSRERGNRRRVAGSAPLAENLGKDGLVGSGRTQLAETIFGITPADAGEIRVSGRALPGR